MPGGFFIQKWFYEGTLTDLLEQTEYYSPDSNGQGRPYSRRSNGIEGSGIIFIFRCCLLKTILPEAVSEEKLQRFLLPRKADDPLRDGDLYGFLRVDCIPDW